MSREVDIIGPETVQDEKLSPTCKKQEVVDPARQSTMCLRLYGKRTGKQLTGAAGDILEEKQRAHVSSDEDFPDNDDSDGVSHTVDTQVNWNELDSQVSALNHYSGAGVSSEDLSTIDAVVSSGAGNDDTETVDYINRPDGTYEKDSISREQVMIKQIELPDTASHIDARLKESITIQSEVLNRGVFCEQLDEIIHEVKSTMIELPGTAESAFDRRVEEEYALESLEDQEGLKDSGSLF